MDLNEQLRMKKTMDLLNSKVKLVLPELMSSNSKLGERLKNKLKVSTLFNNIEQRNRKYLNGFIYSSNKRANYLKTGLDIKKAIKQSNKNIKPLCKQMEEDLIMKNMDLLLNEKKLISENTEQETHMKLNNLLSIIKKAIKPPMITKQEEPKKDAKIFTENEVDKMKDYLGQKIIIENKDIQNNITSYVNKLNDSFGNGRFEKEENKNKVKREFNRFVETLNFKKHIKLINYQKPKPVQIKDKESANLLRIKKLLYPSNLSKKELNKITNTFQMKRNSSMNDIYKTSINNMGKMGGTVDSEGVEDVENIKNIEVNGRDTMQVLTSLAKQQDYLTQRMNNKLKRINSLIDIKLPYLNNYDLILKYVNKTTNTNINHKYIKEKDENLVLSPMTDVRGGKIKLKPFMRKKLLALKKDIENIPINKESYYNHIFDEKHINMYNNLKSSFINNKTNIKTTADKNEQSAIIDSSSNNETLKKGDTVFITSKK